MNKLIETHKYNFLYVLLFFAVGISLVEDFKIFGLLALFFAAYVYTKIEDKSSKNYFLTHLLAFSLLFAATIMWSVTVKASGWENGIWVFDANQLLFVILVISSLMVGLAAALLALLFRYLAHKYLKDRFDAVSKSLLFAITIFSAELVMSIVFGLINRGEGTPVEPFWNFHSISLLLPLNTVTGNIVRLLGFWGTSFFVLFVLSLGSKIVFDESNRNKKEVGVLAGFILVVMVLGSFSFSVDSGDLKQVDVYVSKTVDEDNSHLENLESAVMRVEDTPTILVLPEYSALLRPYPAGIASAGNEDYRDTLLELAQDKPVYFVGTEDSYEAEGRIIETYLANNDLEKLKRLEKDFLVPGGEYIVGWLGSIFNKLDPTALAGFRSERGRSVTGKELPNESEDYITNHIGIGACSAVLTPQTFTNQSGLGALVLVNNSSYVQFNDAPEYEEYARRFAKFIAVSNNRPFASGAVDGQAFVMNSSGEFIASTDNEGLAVASVDVSNTKDTIYNKLGDQIIVGLIYVFALGCFVYLFVRKQSKN